VAGPSGEPDGIPAGRMRRAAPLLGTAARTTGEAVIDALRRRGRPPEELDYRLEASSQQLFADAYRDHPFIAVPQIIPERSTRRVLTQELANGVPWDAARGAGQRLRDAWGEAIYRFAFGSLRRLRAFNADPHPGNYLFRRDGSVVFLDFGCVKRFDADQVAQMQDLARAAVRQDARALWHAFVELGFFAATDGLTPQEVLDWYSGPFEMLLGPAAVQDHPRDRSPDHRQRGLAHRPVRPGGEVAQVARRLCVHEPHRPWPPCGLRGTSGNRQLAGDPGRTR
jgi:hypothetical protein